VLRSLKRCRTSWALPALGNGPGAEQVCSSFPDLFCGTGMETGFCSGCGRDAYQYMHGLRYCEIVVSHLEIRITGDDARTYENTLALQLRAWR